MDELADERSAEAGNMQQVTEPLLNQLGYRARYRLMQKRI